MAQTVGEPHTGLIQSAGDAEQKSLSAKPSRQDQSARSATRGAAVLPPTGDLFFLLTAIQSVCSF
jgi:hypothetical protein